MARLPTVVVVEVVRLLVARAHHAECIGAVRGPIVLTPKADGAGLVVHLMIPAERIETGEQGSALNQIEGKSRRPASTRFRAAPLPWLGTVVTKKPASGYDPRSGSR